MNSETTKSQGFFLGALPNRFPFKLDFMLIFLLLLLSSFSLKAWLGLCFDEGVL